jgi:hypothetical protein
MPFILIATILALLTLTVGESIGELEIDQVAETFAALQNFTGPWSDLTPKFCVCSGQPLCKTPSILLHFVFRYFSTTKKYDSKDFGGPFNGLKCDWEGGLLKSKGQRSRICRKPNLAGHKNVHAP